jgi:hypothetical protein
VLRRLVVAAGAHPGGELGPRGRVIIDDGFHEVRFSGEEQLAARSSS